MIIIGFMILMIALIVCNCIVLCRKRRNKTVRYDQVNQHSEISGDEQEKDDLI